MEGTLENTQAQLKKEQDKVELMSEEKKILQLELEAEITAIRTELGNKLDELKERDTQAEVIRTELDTKLV